MSEPARSASIRSPLRDAFEPLRPHLNRVFVFSLITGLLALAPSVYMLQVYGRVLNARSVETLVMLTLLIVGIYVFLETLDYVRQRMLHEVGRMVDIRTAPQVFEAIFEARLRHLPGGTLHPLSDWRTVRDFLPSSFVSSLLELPVTVVFLGILYWVNPLLGWVAIAGALLQIAIAWLTERSTQPPLAAAHREAAAAQQSSDHSLRHVEVVEAMGMQHAVYRRWVAHQQKFLQLQAIASTAGGGYQALSRHVQLVLTSGMLGLACWLLLQDDLRGGPGMMVVASIIGARALQPLVTMVAQWRAFVNARDAWVRLNQLLSGVTPRQPGMALPRPTGALTVEPLMAGAPALPGQPVVPILRGLQFDLKAGDLLAVIGPSSSGKSTLAKVLIGLWVPLQGKVRLDGVDVATWHKRDLGPHLGYLPQSVELFEGTVRDNIVRFGQPDPELLRRAIEQADLDPLLASLPSGIETEVGPDGTGLSGGQRQRVALARAFYGDPALVVLDEPNASLDEAGDAALLRALHQARQRHTTVVIITHRISILKAVDKVLILENGVQRAFGPRDEVLQSLRHPATNGQPTHKQIKRVETPT